MNRATVIRRATAWTLTFIMSGFGFTGVVSAQTITNTGPGSTNVITNTTTNTCDAHTTNSISARNSNTQIGASGDASANDNTGASLSWDGWAALDPAQAQADGISYQSWNSQATDWISQRAAGNNWNSTEDNLSWMPASTSWSSWNPLDWQANGQSFGNWYNGVESYLDSNSAAWVLGWPADATGSAQSGATTGSVTNTNSSNFTIAINNAARAAAGINACGQSAFTPPPTGGKGGGGGWTQQPSNPSYASSGSAYRASGGQGGQGGYYSAPQYTSHTQPATVASTPVPQNTDAPVQNTPAPTPSAPCPPPVPASIATISNTGPGSTNTVTSTRSNTTTVTNTNTASTSNTNFQYGSTGSSSASSNTAAGSGTSGTVGNGNGTTMGADLSS